VVPIKKSVQDWTLEERFNTLLETAGLSQEACGAYCRQRGIYQHQLTQWREAFMQPKNEGKHTQELAELKALRAENKALKKELNRKDNALAETSALLILKKKQPFSGGK
jgi:transposase